MDGKKYNKNLFDGQRRGFSFKVCAELLNVHLEELFVSTEETKALLTNLCEVNIHCSTIQKVVHSKTSPAILLPVTVIPTLIKNNLQSVLPWKI